MSMNQLRVVVTGLLYLGIFLSGFWLSNSGKPYNTIIFTIHKLISLAAIIFLVRTIYQIHQVASLSVIELLTGVVTGLLFIGTIVSGSLLSIDRPMPAVILVMHQVTPFLTALATTITLYLLFSQK